MSIKRKLILIGVCIVIVMSVFTANVIRKMNEEQKEEQEQTILREDVITQAEAFRLLSYLAYNKTERENLPVEITYQSKTMAGWYDTFVNAVCNMGLINSNVTVDPKQALTYGSCKKLIDQLIIKNPEYQTVYTGLSFDFSKSGEQMAISDFMQLYDGLVSILPEDQQKVKTENLLVLGIQTQESGTSRMITDKNPYSFGYARDYQKYYEQKEQAGITPGPAEAVEDWSTDLHPDQYVDQTITALVCDQELLYIKGLTTEQVIVHNVWIVKGEGLQIDTFVNGMNKSMTALYKLSEPMEQVIADITVEQGKIVKITQKPDVILGKVLQTGKDYIEIEGYGKVPLEEDYRIYKIYGKLSMEPTNSILVGYDNTRFVVSSGKISAALITESIKAENIRVLLQTSGYGGYIHDKVELTATCDYTVGNKEQQKKFKKGEIVTIKPGDKLFTGGRLTIKTKEEGAKIELLSIERSDGNPNYRGTIEISEEDQGLLLINELPLEEYLYAVIPSEMPTYYGMEALRVQAVCARSYAYRQLMANSLGTYGAHVDDSVSYQVYNNISENEDTILAVKDTYGKVIEYEDQVITAYYFSTSCGHTADVSGVWGSTTEVPYLTGKLLYRGELSAAEEKKDNPKEEFDDLSSEETFRSFIEATDVPTYDSSFNWYRWKVTIKAKDIKKVLEASLAARYTANPQLILTKTGEKDENGEDRYESIPVDSIGDIVDISVEKRERSGIISALLITGSKNTVKVLTEYNIRTLLAPVYDTLIRQDESEVDNLKLLPSAFFTLDKKNKNNKLNSVTLIGGGFGHGVGMSQNGVKALAEEGKDFESIIKYFYEGTTLGFIYE